MLNGMESANIIYHSFEGPPHATLLNDLRNLYQSLFEDADLKFFEHRLNTQQDVLIVCGYSSSKLIGFKIGYRYDNLTFYSWVGGVDINFRKQGIATKLAMLQEEWVKTNGYQKIRTKSMNRFKPMMALNLKNGFDITKIYTNTKGQTKIVFEKHIN